MKKIISLFLVLTLSLSLVACGQEEIKDYVPPTPPTIQTTPTETESTEPTKETVEPSEKVELTFSTEVPELTKAENADEKQSHWENKIGSDKFVLDMNNVAIYYQDLFTMEAHLDDAGKKVLKLCGTLDGVEQKIELYIISEEEAYFREYMVENEQVSDKWYKVDAAASEDQNLYDVSLTNNENDAYIKWQESIQEITYLGSNNGIDYVEIKYTEEDEMASDYIVKVDSTFEVEYNGQTGVFHYYEQTDSTESFSAITRSWETKIDGLDLMDWEFDTETMTLTKEDEVLTCKLISDNLSATPEMLSVVLALNPEENTLIAMYMELDGINVAMDLRNISDLSDVMSMPEDINEEITLEDVAMRLAMSLMMFAFSLA